LLIFACFNMLRFASSAEITDIEMLTVWAHQKVICVANCMHRPLFREKTGW
jgi:hypothetical protein